jgi:hypothetical protein
MFVRSTKPQSSIKKAFQKAKFIFAQEDGGSKPP